MSRIGGYEHAAYVDRSGNVDTGRYDINVGNSFRGSFAEVRDERTGRVVDRIFDGQSGRLPNGKTVSFDADRRGQEITVRDESGHVDKFSRSSRPGDGWEREHIRNGSHDCHAERPDHDCRPEHSDHDCRPEGPGGDCRADRGFNVDERNNTVDTGRYLISASGNKDGELNVYDKYTNQFVNFWGDPHYRQSNGATGDFKDRFTLNLEDGTKITVIPDGREHGYLQSVMITKDGDAAEIHYDGNHNPETDRLYGRDARLADRRTPDGFDFYGDLNDIDFDKLAFDDRRKYDQYRG